MQLTWFYGRRFNIHRDIALPVLLEYYFDRRILTLVDIHYLGLLWFHTIKLIVGFSRVQNYVYNRGGKEILEY